LLAEITESGAPIREYIYAANQRIALVDYQQNTQCVVYFMVSDHLDTPQLLLDAQQQVVWSVDQSPFGEVKVEGSDVRGICRSRIHSASVYGLFGSTTQSQAIRVQENAFTFLGMGDLFHASSQVPLGLEDGVHSMLLGKPLNYCPAY
jgi:hypothetical protein